MLLYKVAFVCTFGRGAQRVVRAALVRMSILASGSIGLGLTLANLLPPLPAQESNFGSLLCSSVFITQIIVVVALFASYGVIRPGRNDVLARLLLYWPIRRHSAWLALLMPGCVLSLLAVGLVAPPLYVLFTQLGISWWAVSIAITVGWLSALGIIYGLPRRYGWLQVVVTGAILSAHYWLIHLMYSQLNNPIVILAAWGLLLIFSVALLGRSFYSLVNEAAFERHSGKTWGRFLPSRYWFIKKLCRGHVTKIGVVATVLMSSTLYIVMWRLAMPDVSLMGTAAAVLVAALASDVRSLAKRLRPFEIAGLQGTLHFTAKQFVATTLVCTFAICPLLIGIAILSGSMQLLDWVDLVGLPLLLGISCGLFASTLIAPGPRDITAQSGATLLATGIFILPQLSVFSQLTDTTVGTIKVTLLIALLIGAVFIEYKRNPFTWRKS